MIPPPGGSVPVPRPSRAGRGDNGEGAAVPSRGLTGEHTRSAARGRSAAAAAALVACAGVLLAAAPAALAGSDRHTCGVKQSGKAKCWGADGDGQASPPGGKFDSISAGGFHSCGVRPNGKARCWGLDGAGQASPPGGRFESVSAGG